MTIKLYAKTKWLLSVIGGLLLYYSLDFYRLVHLGQQVDLTILHIDASLTLPFVLLNTLKIAPLAKDQSSSNDSYARTPLYSDRYGGKPFFPLSFSTY